MNLRPTGPKPVALPSCATRRRLSTIIVSFSFQSINFLDYPFNCSKLFQFFQPLFQLNFHRHNLVNIRFPLRLGDSHKLLMALPQIHQKAERHKPHLLRSKVQLSRSVIEQPGEQFCVVHSAVTAFFDVSSLSTLRFVPFSIASVIASLYSASSPGEVRSSTVSSVRSGFFSLFLRLCISML